MNIYDLTGDRYFIPLASKNKNIYLNVILFLHNVINDLFESGENDRVKIIELVKEHLDEMLYVEFYNEDNLSSVDNTLQLDNGQKANLIINKLIDYGWLEEESVGNGKRSLDFNSHSYSFIQVIEEVSKNKKVQYTSYVRTINRVIETFNYNIIDDLETIDATLEDFIVALRSLRSTLQKYYKNITKNKDDRKLEQLLDEFTGEYKEYFFDSAYLNLKIRDNVEIELPKLEAKLHDKLDDPLGLEMLIKARIDKNYDELNARVYVNDTKKRIMTNLRAIPSIMEMIDVKNEKYVTRTVSIIIHLITRGEDISGILHRLIDYVKENDEIDEPFISLFEMKHYTFDALSKPRKYKKNPKPDIMEIDSSIDPIIKEKSLQMLKDEIKYSVKSVNEFVKNFLQDKNERYAHELKLADKNELIMLVSILMYSKQAEVVYFVKTTNNRINENGISFSDFMIIKKESI